MKTTEYTARFSYGTVTRNSAHAYKTAAVAVKDGKPYGRPAFSKDVARAEMPGDASRRGSRCQCYNEKEKNAMRKRGDAADVGWTVEIVTLTTNH